MQNTHPPITSAARRLCRQHNNDERLASGAIYLVEVATGRIVSNATWSDDTPSWLRNSISPVAVYAATETDELRSRGYRLLRVGHGRITQAYAARFLAGEVSG